MRELSRRVGHLLETCINRGHFASMELWRKRTRGCVEAIADLVVRGDADLDWFGKIGRALGSIGDAEKISISEGLDQSFVSPWTCLSIMAIRRAMCHPDSLVRISAKDDLVKLASLQGQEGDVDERVLQVAEKIDNDFKWAWECLRGLRSSLFDGPELTKSESQNKLSNHEKEITELERLRASSNDMIQLDKYIADAWRKTHDATQELTSQLPGVRFDAPLRKSESVTFNETLRFLTDPFKPLSLLPRRQLQGLCSLAPRLRDIIDERNVERLQETLDSLKAVPKVEDWLHLEYLMEDQLARLQDLRDSDGFGLAVELFFVTLEKMLPTYPLEESQHDLYLSTFKRITSDREKCRVFLGTQKVILGVVRDLAMRLPGDEIPVISDFACPSAFTDGLLDLLRDMLAGTSGQPDHIARAKSKLTAFRSDQGMRGQFVNKVLEVLPSSDSDLPPS
ncbi:hypothetical protein BGW80DRAFT_630756 [Lactifluus volemus]|nr:hypothetical protein BGW80DRAFT_630756 [Lactifluus volemus]